MHHAFKKIEGVTVKLLPCPFCSGEPEWVVVPGDDYIIRCSDCHASTKKARMTPEDAANKWNAGRIEDTHYSIIEDRKIDEYLTNGVKNVLFSGYIFDEFPPIAGGFLCSNAVILTDKMILHLDPNGDYLLYDELGRYSETSYIRPIAPDGTKIQFRNSIYCDDLLTSLSFLCGDKTVTLTASADEECMIVYEE